MSGHNLLDGIRFSLVQISNLVSMLKNIQSQKIMNSSLQINDICLFAVYKTLLSMLWNFPKAFYSRVYFHIGWLC